MGDGAEDDVTLRSLSDKVDTVMGIMQGMVAMLTKMYDGAGGKDPQRLGGTSARSRGLGEAAWTRGGGDHWTKEPPGLEQVDLEVEKLQVRTLQKKEARTEEEEEEELDFEEGVRGKVLMQGFVRKWFADKGFGFVEVKGYSVFCHADRVVGQDWLRVGSKAWVKVVEDRAREEKSWKAAEAWEPARWEEEQARRKAEEAVKTAAKAAQIACRSVEKGQKLMEEAAGARVRIAGYSGGGGDGGGSSGGAGAGAGAEEAVRRRGRRGWRRRRGAAAQATQQRRRRGWRRSRRGWRRSRGTAAQTWEQRRRCGRRQRGRTRRRSSRAVAQARAAAAAQAQEA